MILDIKDFRASKDIILEMYEKGGIKKLQENMCFIGINLTAAYTFCNEKHPSRELDEAIARLCKFYGYDEVVG